MKRKPEDRSHLEPVVVHNSTTGQTMTTTVKLYGSIYRDKGFAIVDRENAAKAGGSKPNGKSSNPKKSEPVSTMPGGTAADVAARLGLDKEQTDPATPNTASPSGTPDPALPPAGNDDAIETDIDDTGAQGRDAVRRDRGRTS